MEGEVPMPDQPPMSPTSPDFPDHWGFYLLQAINRLEDNTTQAIQHLDTKIDEVRRDQERMAESLRQELGGVRQELGSVRQEVGSVRQELGSVRQEVGSVRQELGSVRQALDQKIDDLDTKFDHKLTSLQYWYWSTLIVIIVGFVTLFFTRP